MERRELLGSGCSKGTKGVRRMDKTWMIYGANGYTGELIAREAVKRGHRPVLAGRNQAAIETLAQQLGTNRAVFDLSDSANLLSSLSGINLVLNCAGPVTRTVRPLLAACMAANCHYLDITGEPDVFEHCFDERSHAEEAGCVVCPGVGFDIVATEAAAAKLSEILPSAQSLKLGWDASGMATMSPGSLITSLTNPRMGAHVVRENGRLVNLTRPRIERMAVAADQPPKEAVAVAMGELNAVFYSTGIPNIAFYMPANSAFRAASALMTWLKPVFMRKGVRSSLYRTTRRMVKGPSAEQREAGSALTFAEARNPDGEIARIYFKTADGYKFTYLAALPIVERCLSSKRGGGYYTPSMLMGTDFVPTLEGSSSYHIEYVPAATA
jgi:short subunit dehydrogenase-like uncharacterized protein